ncbi:neutral zinc metallopeptidase [Saccharomonospora sp. CUA-673]|uniref:neutral zinc metallopeptidase n=1 Tax=Saccharomonospora sp. CUA-673 TaxID=1904969 RepID=UPI0035182DE0
MRTTVRVAAACTAAALVLTACAGERVEGELQTEGDVAGLPVTHFESGLKENAPEPDLRAQGITDEDVDQLALASAADTTDYWDEVKPQDFDEPFEHVEELLSYNPETDSIDVCGANTSQLGMNAFYCPLNDMVAWDRGVLMPLLNDKFGPMAVTAVISHEYGHAVQTRLGEKAGIDDSTSTIVKEQQADCFMGAHMRWIAEGNSDYFELSTSDGLNEVLGALFMIRDPAGTDFTHDGAHGSGFDRTYAVQLGFEEGAARCADIDQAEAEERITEVPFRNAADRATQGEAPINMTTMGYVQRSLDAAFSGAGVEPPKLVEGDGTCNSGVSTPPVSFCEDANEVNMDMATLQEIGQPADLQADAPVRSRRTRGWAISRRSRRSRPGTCRASRRASVPRRQAPRRVCGRRAWWVRGPTTPTVRTGRGSTSPPVIWTRRSPS